MESTITDLYNTDPENREAKMYVRIASTTDHRKSFYEHRNTQFIRIPSLFQYDDVFAITEI